MGFFIPTALAEDIEQIEDEKIESVETIEEPVVEEIIEPEPVIDASEQASVVPITQ